MSGMHRVTKQLNVIDWQVSRKNQSSSGTRHGIHKLPSSFFSIPYISTVTNIGKFQVQI